MNKKPLFSFGIMSDCQYADADDVDVNVRGTDEYIHNRYRQSPRKLREAITEFNQHDLQFIAHMGDFIDRGLADADTLLQITGDAKAPIWHVLGNHDFLNNEDKHDQLLECLGIPGKYYAKEIANYRFLMLDTNDLGMIEHVKGSPEWEKGKAYFEKQKQAGILNAYPWNGGIDIEQMSWIEHQLEEAASKQQKVILFSHHPVFPPNVHNALNDAEILALIDTFSNVTAYMNGHNHLGNFGKRGTVPYLTLNGMLEGDQNAFGIVHVFDDHIEVEGYGRLSNYSWPLSA